MNQVLHKTGPLRTESCHHFKASLGKETQERLVRSQRPERERDVQYSKYITSTNLRSRLQLPLFLPRNRSGSQVSLTHLFLPSISFKYLYMFLSFFPHPFIYLPYFFIAAPSSRSLTHGLLGVVVQSGCMNWGREKWHPFGAPLPFTEMCL